MQETEISIRLKNKLKVIWDNPDFIRGVPDTLCTDENMIKMESLLNKGLTDSSKIVLIALAIKRNLI